MAIALRPRDREIFRALTMGPLTVRQLLKLSETFAFPFTSERMLQQRLLVLTTAGLLQRHEYSTASSGILYYYTLSPESSRLLYGRAGALARHWRGVGISRQEHTRALMDLLVHLVVGVHRAGFELTDFARENTLRLEAAGITVYPDAAFTIVAPLRPSLRFFVELDTGTEPVLSERQRDSWQRKLAFYATLRRSCGYRFRMLCIPTTCQSRLDHIVAAVQMLTRGTDCPPFFLGACLADVLETEDPMGLHCFRDGDGQVVALVPPVQRPLEMPTAPAPLALAQGSMV